MKYHGGGCCGMRHLCDFDEEDEGMPFKDKLALIKTGLERARNDGGYGIEVVLADYQFTDWQRALHRMGFRKKFEFLNGNSGRVCRVYFFAFDGETVSD
jgi:hypothetical protein